MSKKVQNTKNAKIVGKVDAIKYVEENGFPEIGAFEDKKDLQKFYKQLPMESINEWIALEGISYNVCEEAPAINRMRACMAILYLHFPKAPSTGTKKKSKYADYTTEQLIQMAVDKDVAVEVTEDMRIMRMRTIMALRASKVID